MLALRTKYIIKDAGSRQFCAWATIRRASKIALFTHWLVVGRHFGWQLKTSDKVILFTSKGYETQNVAVLWCVIDTNK